MPVNSLPHKAEELGAKLATQLIAELGTTDVFEIAARLGAKIEYRSWPLVTVGEFDSSTGKITVNNLALAVTPVNQEAEKAIVAHELCHFVLTLTNNGNLFDKPANELAAHAFAAVLLGDGVRLQELQSYWRDAYDKNIFGH